jgi:hypothetical protein
MVTVALVSVTLSLTASLMTMYSRGSRVADVQSSVSHAQELLLYRIRSEALGAVDFLSPAGVGGGFQPELEFQRVDRHRADRLEDFPLNWTPYGIGATNDFLVEVRYRSQDQALLRGVRESGSSQYRESTLLPRDVIALGARRPDDQTVEVELEMKTNRATRKLKARFMRRVR